MHILRNLIHRLIHALPAAWAERMAVRLLRRLTEEREPPAVLRSLFRVNLALDRLQDLAAIEYGSGIHPKHRLMRYHDFFIQRIREDDRILDIGCGDGTVDFDIVQKTGARVVGLDSNPDNVSKATARYQHERLEFRLGEAKGDLPDGPFTAVILSNVLEHLAERVDFLKRLSDTVHPNRILIRVPLFERDWRVPLRMELQLDWRMDETHETEYTPESFVKEIEAAGLKIAHHEIRWGEIWAEVERPAPVRE
ncbi:MAG: class I SAM-dependent methyltransferase [Nitrospirae bacterium]|nr:class I SAM-dependent methyltransferase [Nitrospirota bacterium]